MLRPAPLRSIATLVLAALLALPASAAMAGQAQMDLLASYVGNWRGTGKLTGGDQPETFTCRMIIAKGNKEKINYSGRCALTFIPLNLGVSGTIAYNDAQDRYEGAMTSNTAYSGLAIGRQRGQTITFDFQTRERDDKGQDLTVGSKISLDSGQITVNFDVEFNDSGEKMFATVPFERR